MPVSNSKATSIRTRIETNLIVVNQPVMYYSKATSIRTRIETWKLKFLLNGSDLFKSNIHKNKD